MIDLKLPKQRLYVRDAAFTKRALSFIADLLIMDFTLFASFSFLNVTLQDALHTQKASVIASAVVMSLLAFAYFSLFEWVLGQTPGMMLFNLKTEVKFWQALVRNCYFIPVFPFPILMLTEPLVLLWQKQRWLEQLTKTRTVEIIAY